MPPRKKSAPRPGGSGRAKKRLVTFDDSSGEVVATTDAGKLAASVENEDESDEGDENNMDGPVIEPEDDGDEEGDDDEGDDLSEFLPPGVGPEGVTFRQPRATDPQTAPVSNKNFIPLFPDASKKPKHHASAIKVYKRTPPHDGFKGKLTNVETVDEEYLSGLYGDGVYDLVLIDQLGNELRKRTGVKVAIGAGLGGPDNKKSEPSGPAIDVESIIARVTKSANDTVESVTRRLEADRAAEREAAKQDRLAEKERNDRFVQMQTSLVKEQGESMRAHYAAGAAQSAENTKALLTIMSTGHQQMMQQMMAMQASQGGGKELLQAFIAGLGERQDGNEKDATTTIVDGITGGLKELRGLAEASKQNGGGGNLPATTTSAITKRPVKPNTGKPAAAAAPAQSAGAAPKKEIISKQALQDILELKAAAEARGVPFEDLIKQAKAFYVNGTVPDDMLGDDEGDEGDEELDDADEEQGEEGTGEGGTDDGNKKSAEPTKEPADAVEGT